MSTIWVYCYITMGHLVVCQRLFSWEWPSPHGKISHSIPAGDPAPDIVFVSIGPLVLISVVEKHVVMFHQCQKKHDWWCFCQRTENRAREKHVFARACSEVTKGWGGGGMLTFLVLLPLHVATLHRCLVVLHLCIHCRNGSQCWKVDTWVAIARVGCHEGVGLGGAC